jgi:transketolase
MTDLVKHQRMANAIRALAMDAVERANSGHPGMPMGMADVATVLFTRYLKFDPTAPRWRTAPFVSPPAMADAPLPVLYLLGVEDMTIDESEFPPVRLEDRAPQNCVTVGRETTTGRCPGPRTVGSARRAPARPQFGDSVVDHHTYVIAQTATSEGLSHEAISMPATSAKQADRALRRQQHLDRRALSLAETGDQVARFRRPAGMRGASTAATRTRSPPPSRKPERDRRA